MRRLACLVLLSASLVAPVARAQSTAPFEGLMMQQFQTQTLLKPGLDNAKRRAEANDRRLVPSPRPTTAPHTRYAASPAVSAKVRTQYLDWLKDRAPGDAQAMGQAFQRETPVALWSKAVAADGLRPGDVSDAMGSYWLLNWMIANGRTANTAAEARAVREQARRGLAAQPRFAALGDAQRQEIAETYMVNFVVQAAAYEKAMRAGDRATAARLGEAARSRMQRELGVDFTRMRVTPQGLTPA